MLGTSIDDPGGVESAGKPRTIPGLAKLPIRTVMRGEKTVRRAAGQSQAFSGYEIHMGETIYERGAVPFATILREGETQPVSDGAVEASGRVWGTYVHGLFDDDSFRHRFLIAAREQCGLPPAHRPINATAERQARMDRWANHLRQSLDMNLIRSWIWGAK